MNDLLALIARYGGVVEFASDAVRFGQCTECRGCRAIAEVISTDYPDSLEPCGGCLPGAIEKAQMASEDAGDRNPRITVTVARPAVAVPDVATARAA